MAKIVMRSNFTALKGLSNALKQAPQELTQELAIEAEAVTDELSAMLETYPAKKKVKLRGQFQGFYTKRQRRFVMWALRVGRLIVPYPRTGTLANSWQVITLIQAKQLNITLRNVATYASRVMGAGTKQAQFLKGYWKTALEIVQAYRPIAARRLAQAGKRAIRNARRRNRSG